MKSGSEVVKSGQTKCNANIKPSTMLCKQSSELIKIGTLSRGIMCVTRLQLIGFRIWLQEVMGAFQTKATNSKNLSY